MKCKEIQDIILTDYVDNELSAEHRILIEGHLRQCKDCQMIAQAARNLDGTLSDTKGMALDEDKIWLKIEKRIQEDASQSTIYTPVADQGDLYGRLIRFLRPTLALATVACLILMATVFLKSKSQEIAQVDKIEEVQYLALVAEGLTYESEVADVSAEDFGTDIEAYFL